MPRYNVTLVTEAYNLAEGMSEEAYRVTLGHMLEIGRRRGDVELMVVDPSDEGLGLESATAFGPEIRYLAIPGAKYEQQKTRAVEAAQGEIVAYLDGDCRPDNDYWFENLMQPFDHPQVQGVGGLTLYDDLSLTGKAMSVLDLGFLFLRPGEIMGCYASNNMAFRRSTWMACPPPDGHVRSTVYAHAQQLIREQRPLVFQPAALAWHELPDVRATRYRRGYEHVGACWVDPLLAETAWLAEGEAAWSRFLNANKQLHSDRLMKAPARLEISEAERPAILQEMDRLREADAEGIRDALAEGERRGFNAKALADRRAVTEADAARLAQNADPVVNAATPVRVGVPAG